MSRPNNLRNIALKGRPTDTHSEIAREVHEDVDKSLKNENPQVSSKMVEALYNKMKDKAENFGPSITNFFNSLKDKINDSKDRDSSELKQELGKDSNTIDGQDFDREEL